ncbi:hypothetical protein BDU57DRAFT_523718 [Ampelomyces quisqualis]|uniref:Uncharacterized protein n=1 Tax=Ampelomyces quisqualis TaxID=50730 RepID=A0A6A5QA58_AMPQU|nr:hypothetical protein BDU57DRAFT_523718 [Ampelomyces quisqualis]
MAMFTPSGTKRRFSWEQYVLYNGTWGSRSVFPYPPRRHLITGLEKAAESFSTCCHRRDSLSTSVWRSKGRLIGRIQNVTVAIDAVTCMRIEKWSSGHLVTSTPLCFSNADEKDNATRKQVRSTEYSRSCHGYDTFHRQTVIGSVGCADTSSFDTHNDSSYY